MTVEAAASRRKAKAPSALMIGAIIVGVVAIAAVCAPLIAPYPPNGQNLSAALQAPSLRHLFGTDSLGRDIFSRVLYGGRYELSVIVPAVLIVTFVGVPIGMASGYRPGWTDRIISLVSDSMLTFPSIVLAIVLVAIFGNGYTSLVVTIALTQVPQMVRYARGFTRGVAGADFILASRASGAGPVATLGRHVVPNIGGTVVVVASLLASEVLLAIAALGFLGVGVQPPTPEWGTMLSDGRQDFQTAPQVMIFPGSAIAVLILGFNLLGDGLRDFVDKRSL